MSEQNETQDSKPCLECGENLGVGRGDRKFCNDACRTAFNNKRRKPPGDGKSLPVPLMEGELQQMRDVYLVLLKNYDILHGLIYYLDTDDMLLRDLIGKGFNLKYFTSQYTNVGGDTYNFCFHYGYHVKDDRVYFMLRAEETSV